MRSLREDEIDYLLGQGEFEFYFRFTPLRKPKNVISVERRLKNLGLLEIDVPRIPGYQVTLYRCTPKGLKIRGELLTAYEVLNQVMRLKEYLRRQKL